METATSINVFGTVTIRRHGAEDDMTGSLPGYVLRILVLAAGTAVSTGRLVKGIYEGTPPRTAPAQLQAHISRLRKALGPRRELIRTVGDGYRLDPDGISVDVGEFDRLCAAGDTAVRRGDLPQAVQHLRGALDTWDVLELPDPVGAGVDARLNQLHLRKLSALESLIRVQLLLGERSSMTADLEHTVRANPVDERLRSLLMQVHYRNGRQDRALQEYDDIRRILDDNLGVVPGPELQHIHALILRHDPALLPAPQLRTAPQPTAPSPAPPAAVRLSPARTSPAPVRGGGPRQLPARHAGAVVRQAVVERTRTALAGGGRGEQPAVAVITGPGGSGKSVLALHVAYEVAGRYPAGHLYANLTGTRPRPAAAADVLARFLKDLGLRDRDIPDGVDERAALFRSCTARQAFLLVLDDADRAAQVEPLLPAEPRCAVVVTSRAALPDLRAAADRVRLGALATDDALTLLRDHVGPARMDAEREQVRAVVELCAGLPLALDLLGARMAAKRHWNFGDVAALLENTATCLDVLEIDGRGVRSALAAAFRKLDARTQGLLRTVCRQGLDEFTPETAAAAERSAPAEVHERLERLVEAHFLTVDRDRREDRIRYRCHHLVRAFAREHFEPFAAGAATGVPAAGDAATARLGRRPSGSDPGPAAAGATPCTRRSFRA